jgi:hypothetical protein
MFLMEIYPKTIFSSLSTSLMSSLPGSSESSASNMLKIKQGLILQKLKTSWSCQQVHSRTSGSQSHGRKSNNVILDPLLLASIIEDKKVLGVLGTLCNFIWIHEEFLLDPPRVVCIRPIHLVYLFTLGTK